MTLDEVDLKILNILQKNARTTASSISEKISMSIPAITRRIQKMEDLEIIKGYRIIIDHEKVDMNVHGYLIASVQSTRLPRFYDYIQKIDNITRCETIISGGKEIILEFYFSELNQLMEFYESQIRDYIDSMTVYLVKGIPKQEKTIPLKKINKLSK